MTLAGRRPGPQNGRMTDTAQPEIGSYIDAGGIKTNYLEAGYSMVGWVDRLVGRRGHRG